MNNKQFLAAIVVAGSLALPALGEARVNVDINIGPPVMRVETAPPPPRAGYLWAPGYWNWAGNRHVWVAGRYIAPHHGFVWVPDHWVQHGPRYRFVPGHWRRA